MKKIISTLMIVFSVFIIAGCSNDSGNETSASSKAELSDIFASKETFYWTYDEEDPAWYSLVRAEDGEVKIVDLETNDGYFCDYTVEKVEDNLYKYSFKIGRNIDSNLNRIFGKADVWKEYNVINLEGNYIFDAISETKDNYNSTYEEVKENYERGLSVIVFSEK